MQTTYHYSKITGKSWQSDKHVKNIFCCEESLEGIAATSEYDFCFCDESCSGIVTIDFFKDQLRTMHIQSVSEEFDYDISNNLISQLVSDFEESPSYYAIKNISQKTILFYLKHMNEELKKCVNS